MTNFIIVDKYLCFKATVLRENEAMIHVFKKRYPHAQVAADGGELSILMDFADAACTPSEAQCASCKGLIKPQRDTS